MSEFSGESAAGRNIFDNLAEARENLIARTAARQRNLVTTAELENAGLSRSSVHRWVQRGRLHRVHRGVYRYGGPAPVPLSDELAAVLACGPGTYLSHRSAAKLWGLPVAASPRLIWVTVTNGSTSRAGIKVSHRRLEAAEVTRRHGIPTVKPARVLIDLASLLSAPDLERALAEARVKNLVQDRELESSSRVEAILRRERGPKLTRSDMERRMLCLLREACIPEPECNAKVHGHRADFLWRPQRLVVETDGWGFHNQHRHFEYDHRSTNHLKAHGYEVLRFTWTEVTRESSKVVALIAGCLG